MTSMTGTRRIVIAFVVLAVASAVAVMFLASMSTSMSSAMSGMDHGSGDASVGSPATTSSGDMPGMDMSGMDHGSGDVTASSPAPTGTGDMPGMDMSGTEHGSGDKPHSHGSAEMPRMSPEVPGKSAAEEAVDRPLAPVLGTFGGGTAAVMLTAGLLRRKDRATREAMTPARTDRRSQK